MATPAPALLQLRAQVDARWPHRSRASDGIMGDAAHMLRRSAHNLGDAWDCTNDPAAGPDLSAMVQSLCRQMRANPGGRLELIIFWGRIYSRQSAWAGRRYFGPNPHRSHAHLEVRHELRSESRPWKVDW